MLGRFYCSPPLSSSPPTQLRKEKQPQNGRHIGASRERQYFLSTLVFRAGPAMNKLPFVGLNIFLIFYLCVVLCVGHRRFIPHGRAQPSPLLPCLRPFLLPPPLFLPTLPSSSSPTHTHTSAPLLLFSKQRVHSRYAAVARVRRVVPVPPATIQCRRQQHPLGDNPTTTTTIVRRDLPFHRMETPTTTSHSV